MSFSDYWNGPAHRQRADELEGELKALQARYSELQQLTHQMRRDDCV